MTRITIDAGLKKQLLNLTQPLELCDDKGAVIARVIPMCDYPVDEDLNPKISREEMERRKRDKGKSYTTAEVLAYLEKL